MSLDWQALHRAAGAELVHAYAPYSKFPVAAAAITDTGQIVTGVNVENGSYGLTLCAECSLISGWVGQGRPGALTGLVCLTGTESEPRVITPCGRCRQLLMEHAGPELLIDTPSGPTMLGALLPESFELT